MKWEFATAGGISSTPAIGGDGIIYAGSEDNNLYALNPDGTMKWKFTMGARIQFTSPAINSDGTIYIASNDGKLHAIATSSKGLASSPWPMFHHDVKHTGRSQ